MSDRVADQQRKAMKWAVAVGSVVGVGFALVFVVRANPDFLVPLAVFAGPGLVAAVVAGVSYVRIRGLRSLPVVAPGEVAAHAGDRVMVAGFATGDVIVSPFSGRECVYAYAEQLRVTYSSNAHGERTRSRSWEPLGFAGA